MDILSTEDREAICSTFSRLLSDLADETRLRQVIETDTGFDPELWSNMADLGLTGILVDPEHGGIGASIVEVEALMEHAGEHLYSGPFISTCVLAPLLLSSSLEDETATAHLKGIAAGSSIFAIAGCGSSGDWSQNLQVNAQERSDGWLLSGVAGFVSYVAGATHCLVYASSKEGNGVYLIDLENNDIEMTHHDTDDRTIRLSSLSFHETRAHKLPGANETVIDNAFHSALVALAGDQVGAARRIFEMTIEYLQTRYQFGQPIGSFQALKHIAADLLIELESASTAAREAARAVATNSEDQQLLCYLAGFTCADSFRKISADAIQLHGGIAYTVEHPAHLYWRRAQTGQWLYSSSRTLKDRYLQEWEKVL
jgi:alkylation response protein AidB-like acyl-CoA dehydrogenase